MNEHKSHELLKNYFPDLSTNQFHQLDLLESCYRDWNERINVISRKDIDYLYEKHVLHSMAIAKFIAFKAGSRILDVGTGGGFPGIPLAILSPDVQFQLVDSIGKKIKVVQAIADALELKNVTAIHARAEQSEEKFDFIVSRAVAPLKIIYDWTKHLLASENKNVIPNGWLILKGGDLHAELQELKKKAKLVPINKYFNLDFFKGKYIVYF